MTGSKCRWPRLSRRVVAVALAGAGLVLASPQTLVATSDETQYSPSPYHAAVVLPAADSALVSWQVMVNRPGTIVRLYRSASLDAIELVAEERAGRGTNWFSYVDRSPFRHTVTYRVCYVLGDGSEVQLGEILRVDPHMGGADPGTPLVRHVDQGEPVGHAVVSLVDHGRSTAVPTAQPSDWRPLPLTPPPEARLS